MNTRIKELAEQAWLSLIDETCAVVSDNGRMSLDFLQAYDRNFAALIIRECADQCLSDDSIRILNHFGIKE